MARLSEWNKAVDTAFKMGRSRNKKYSLKNAMFDAKKIYKKGKLAVLSVGRKSRGRRHRNNRRTRRGGQQQNGDDKQQQQQQNGDDKQQQQDGGEPESEQQQKQQQDGGDEQQQDKDGKNSKN